MNSWMILFGWSTAVSLSLASLPAQSTRTLPADAARADVAGWLATNADSLTAGFRWQQAWSARDLAPTRATLQQIDFRADAGLEYADAFVGTQLQNVDLRLSLEFMAPRDLAVRFADNPRQPQTSVFVGTVALPARSAVPPGTASPWLPIAIGGERALPAIDLGSLGAPDQLLHVRPWSILPTLQGRIYDGGGCSRLSLFHVRVPDQVGLEGARVFGQMLFPSPISNPLGVIVTNAIEVTVGFAPYYDSAVVYGAAASAVGERAFDVAPAARFTGVFQ